MSILEDWCVLCVCEWICEVNMTGEWMCGLCVKYERAVSVINITSV